MFDYKNQLDNILWEIADYIHGRMDFNEYKNCMLGLIFYKYLSEKIVLYLNNELINDHLTFSEAWEIEIYQYPLRDEAIENLGYFLEPCCLFQNIVKKAEVGEFILDDLGRALKHIGDSAAGSNSEDAFENILEDVDLTSSKLGKTVDDRNRLISGILIILSQTYFKLEDKEKDILGDAYEYLICQFASPAGKKVGEFYTPQEVSKILAKIVTLGKKRIKSVYDPTCGSGSLLLRVVREVEEYGDVYGQELNQTTFNLARMNMILHDVKFNDFDIKQGDSIEDPQHYGEKFEAIVANPPFSAKWSADSSFLDDERFSAYGKLAPKSKADFAFVQHMIYHLDKNGIMAVVLPHGILFRRHPAEKSIRKYLVDEKNYLDAVIGLPANIFYDTSIPKVILVFKKCRSEDSDILFIDASKEFEKVKNKNRLKEEDINKIMDVYTKRKEIEKYSHKATLDEIKENDFNLNIPRYVDTFYEE